jgi:hypothetical protein
VEKERKNEKWNVKPWWGCGDEWGQIINVLCRTGVVGLWIPFQWHMPRMHEEDILIRTVVGEKAGRMKTRARARVCVCVCAWVRFYFCISHSPACSDVLGVQSPPFLSLLVSFYRPLVRPFSGCAPDTLWLFCSLRGFALLIRDWFLFSLCFFSLPVCRL